MRCCFWESGITWSFWSISIANEGSSDFPGDSYRLSTGFWKPCAWSVSYSCSGSWGSLHLSAMYYSNISLHLWYTAVAFFYVIHSKTTLFGILSLLMNFIRTRADSFSNGESQLSQSSMTSFRLFGSLFESSLAAGCPAVGIPPASWIPGLAECSLLSLETYSIRYCFKLVSTSPSLRKPRQRIISSLGE